MNLVPIQRLLRGAQEAMGNKSAIIILAAFFVFLAVPRIMFPDLDHGEEWGDSEAMIAGINFDKLGFIKTQFLPLLRLRQDKPTFYTHYPGLSHILTGLYRRLSQNSSLYFYRSIAVIVSFFGVVFWYLSLRLLIGSTFGALLGGLFYLFNPFFIYSMDNIASLSYAALSRNLCIFIFLYAAKLPREKNKRYLILLWLLLLIDSWITFEYIIYLASFFVLFKFFFNPFVFPVREGASALPPKAARPQSSTQKDNFPSWRLILVLFSAPVLGFCLHLLQNAWHFGSISVAIADLKDIALKRTVQTYDTSMAINFTNWLNFVIVRNFNLAFLFPYFVLFLLLFFACLIYQKLSAASRKKLVPFFNFFLILTICGISWYIAFPSHSIAHTYVLFLPIHLLPCASAGFSLFFYSIFLYLTQNYAKSVKAKQQSPGLALAGSAKVNTSIPSSLFKHMKDREALNPAKANIGKMVLKLSAWGLGVVFVLYFGVTKSDLPITREKIEYAADFILFKNMLLDLKMMSTEKDKVAVNYYRSPFIHYYTERAVLNIFDKNSLEALPSPPRYFIFIPYSQQGSLELFQLLSQKYTRIMICRSKRFPSMLFKLKD